VTHIYVDEAQDLSLSQYNLVIELQKSLNAKLTIVGDPL